MKTLLIYGLEDLKRLRKKNYTSIDPKQQQTMFPRRSFAMKNSLVARFLRKETKEKKGDKPGTRAGNQKVSWERKQKKSRETRPGTLAKTTRNQEIMMEQNPFPDKRKERRVGRQTPEP